MHIHFMYYSSFFFANFSQKQDKHLNIYELSIIIKKGFERRDFFSGIKRERSPM